MDYLLKWVHQLGNNMTPSKKKFSTKINEIAKQEFKAMLREAAEKAPDVSKKLEELRKKLEKEMTSNESLGLETFGGTRAQKRVQLKTVSELLDIPVNELMLHFMNEVKATNDRHLVEYHLGMCYFFKE